MISGRRKRGRHRLCGYTAASDAIGRQLPLIILSAFSGAAAYFLLVLVPSSGIGFTDVLVARAVSGAYTVGALSLGLTTLMRLTGGHGTWDDW
jgi:hypothetical protein